MEKPINKKIEQFQVDFKNKIKNWFETNNATIKLNSSDNSHAEVDLTSEFLRFVFDNPSLVLEKEDFQKRKRIKNIVSSNNLCIAKRANGEQCTRSKKMDGNYCGTHVKGIPHGEIDLNSKSVVKSSLETKVDIWVQEIKGINYYIDNMNNVYKHDDIISNKQNPSVIAKWSLTDAGVYKIPEFGI